MNKKVILYIAVSLDGFIADKNGKIDWLDKPKKNKKTNSDFGYKDLLNSIDCILMGDTTYLQVLSFGKWPYYSKQSLVFTKKHLETENTKISFVTGDVKKVINDANYKKFWLVGGANLVNQFLKEKLVSEIIITFVPVLLGNGIRLFGNSGIKSDLVFVSSSNELGYLQAKYLVKSN